MVRGVYLRNRSIGALAAHGRQIRQNHQGQSETLRLAFRVRIACRKLVLQHAATL